MKSKFSYSIVWLALSFLICLNLLSCKKLTAYSTTRPIHLAICKVIQRYYNSGTRYFFFHNTVEYRFSNSGDTVAELRSDKFSSFTFFRNGLKALKDSLVLEDILYPCEKLDLARIGSFEEYMEVVKSEPAMGEGETSTKSWGVVGGVTAFSRVSQSETLVLIRVQEFEVREFGKKAVSYSYPNPSEDYFFIIVRYKGNNNYDTEVYIENFQGM